MREAATIRRHVLARAFGPTLRGGVSRASEADDPSDPFAAVRRLGGRTSRIGAGVALLLALLTHTAASARAMTALYDMMRIAQRGRASLHEYFWATYDIDTKPLPKPEKEEPPPPEPEPEPDPEPAPKAIAPKPKDDPYDQPAAKPAQAAAVLTRQDTAKSDQVEDMTDTVVSGDGTVISGRVSANGHGDQPVTDPHARLDGEPGGHGTGPAHNAPPPGPDLSKPPGLQGGSSWNCPFPQEADSESINSAVVTIVVTVRPDGTASAVSVTRDPGHGFARAARQCALSRRYLPAVDHSGMAILQATPPINVTFSR